MDIPHHRTFSWFSKAPGGEFGKVITGVPD